MLKKHFYIFLLSPMLLVGCKNNSLAEPLHFTCVEGSVSLHYYCDSTQYGEYAIPKFECSRDGKTWKKLEIDDEETLSKGQTIYFRGDNPDGISHYSVLDNDPAENAKLSFYFDGIESSTKISIAGNIMSLLSSKKFDKMNDIPCNGCFYGLFDDLCDENLKINASKLLLPALKIKDYTYLYLFRSSSVVEAPLDLPAKQGEKGCYESMFESAESLLTAPVIHLESLKESSCSAMFKYSTLKVSKNKGKTKFFTCPPIKDTVIDPVERMFYDTKGYQDNPQTGEVFYFN